VSQELIEKVRQELNGIRAEKWVAERKSREEARKQLKRNMESRDRFTRPYRQTKVIRNGVTPMGKSVARRTYVQDLTARQTQLAERILNELAQNRPSGN
jgi:hypothetical protein